MSLERSEPKQLKKRNPFLFYPRKVQNHSCSVYVTLGCHVEWRCHKYEMRRTVKYVVNVNRGNTASFIDEKKPSKLNAKARQSRRGCQFQFPGTGTLFWVPRYRSRRAFRVKQSLPLNFRRLHGADNRWRMSFAVICSSINL